MTNEDILARIETRLRDLGMSERAAGLKAGGSAGLIRNLRRKPDQFPRVDSVRDIAAALEVSPAWLAFGDEAPPVTPSSYNVPVMGEVAAGQWLDVGDAVDTPRYETSSVPYDSRYDPDDQFDLIVRGTSINRVAREGDYLRCLRFDAPAAGLADGALCIVERRRAQGGQVETTAKRLRRRDWHIELWPDSDDDRWQTPIILGANTRDPDETVAVIARVLWSYRQL
ncbi:LexA family protein [Camelimonas sp. ID_303_24]